MAEKILYPGKAFSPQATLTDRIGAADTIIKVSDISAFPDAPNLATIGTDESGETILYTAKTTDALSGCQRGVEGTARTWEAGELIGRNFTAKDHTDMIAAVGESKRAAGEAKSMAESADSTAKEAASKVAEAFSIANAAKETADNVQDAIDSIVNVSAIMHRNIYRGKHLGSSVTAEQFTTISKGEFDDLYIGDYWTINDVNWRIADLDYWYGKGDTECKTHHVVIVPDTDLAAAPMNKTNTTAGGYPGSDLYTGNNDNVGLSTAKTKAKNAFGADHILTKRLRFANAVTNGKPSGDAWMDSDIDLMNEINVYGSYIFSVANDGTTVPNIQAVDNTQFSLFRLNSTLICIRTGWWFRDVASADYYALASAYGNAGYYYASNHYGVRPAFAICA